MKPNARRLLSVVFAICFLTLAPAQALDEHSPADYRARRVALAEKAKGGAVLLFAATEEEGQNATSGFRQENNFFYLTGWDEPGAAVLIVPARAASANSAAVPYTEILFLPARNATQENWTGPKLTAATPNLAQTTGFDRVEVLDKLRDELVRLLPSPRVTVYSDLAGFGTRSTATVPLEWLRRANAFPNYTSFADAKPLLAELRMRKDPGEIARMTAAAKATMAAIQRVAPLIRPGARERDIAVQLDYEWKREGCDGAAFSPIVASGANSSVLHYSRNDATMKTGTVVMDVGCEISGYGADITRTFPVSGQWTPREREIYDIVLGAQRAAAEAFVSGKFVVTPTSPQALYKVAFDYINSHGKDRQGQPLGKYFLHGLGHHIGLETHDAANNNLPLGPGMVFSIEPGIYLPEENIGIRIEDMYMVDAAGKLVCMTCSLGSSAADAEAMMRQNEK